MAAFVLVCASVSLTAALAALWLLWLRTPKQRKLVFGTPAFLFAIAGIVALGSLPPVRSAFDYLLVLIETASLYKDWSPDNTVYASHRPGRSQFVLVDTVHHRTADVDLTYRRSELDAWIGDGRFAVFISDNPYDSRQTRVFDVQAWRMALDTTGCFGGEMSPCGVHPVGYAPHTPHLLLSDGSLVDLNAGTRTPLLTSQHNVAGLVSWSPDESALAFVAGYWDFYAINDVALYLAYSDGRVTRPVVSLYEAEGFWWQDFGAFQWANDSQSVSFGGHLLRVSQLEPSSAGD